ESDTDAGEWSAWRHRRQNSISRGGGRLAWVGCGPHAAHGGSVQRLVMGYRNNSHSGSRGPCGPLQSWRVVSTFFAMLCLASFHGMTTPWTGTSLATSSLRGVMLSVKLVVQG